MIGIGSEHTTTTTQSPTIKKWYENSEIVFLVVIVIIITCYMFVCLMSYSYDKALVFMGSKEFKELIALFFNSLLKSQTDYYDFIKWHVVKNANETVGVGP